MYPLEGNRDVPGSDPDHQGGDVWVTDAAFEVMDNEDWSGLLLTLRRHRQGRPHVGRPERRAAVPAAATTRTRTWPTLAKVADEQVGRVVAEAEGRTGCSTRR